MSGFACFAAGPLLFGHDVAGVDDVEEYKGDEHRERVEAVHECFLIGDFGFYARGVFAEAKEDAERDEEEGCEEDVEQAQGVGFFREVWASFEF